MGSAMTGVISKPDTQRKLEILSDDAKYDLACACGTDRDEGRRRGGDGRWIYPVALPNGGTSVLFKTLISNVCTNDCKYCPLRQDRDIRRCTLSPEETARVFLDYYNRKEVFGLFLSSGVIGSPDATMERLNGTARLLRTRHHFRGYLHLKIIPGASAAAVEEAVSLASAVSLNIETPGAKHLARLSCRKSYLRDIIEPMKQIHHLTARGARFARVKQTTQFIVGPAGEADREIVQYMWGLYDRLELHRIYFSAYQSGLGDRSLPAEQAGRRPGEAFVREHRLYQVDFLMRKYGFRDTDILFDAAGNLSLDADPKEVWAASHPEFFPLDVNRASRLALLRVPGLGPLTVNRILQQRRTQRLGRLEDVARVNRRLEKARRYLVF
jgi:predicted DNA-binding helix-hairpin-helix protein